MGPTAESDAPKNGGGDNIADGAEAMGDVAADVVRVKVLGEGNVAA